ncbi:MAG TPA: Fe-S cluster assembly protein SufD, partial [Devosia sp.]|nr:Fe-S cluster assembly protein SufD [Devosia sp.]
MRAPVRLGAAENALIEQLEASGAGAEAERFGLAGLPTRRVETYHYTDLKALLRAVPPLAVESACTGVSPLDVADSFHVA